MVDKGYVNPGLVWTAERLRERIGERKSDDLVIIDTRPAPDFCVGHIEGAAHLDLYGISLNDTRPEPLAAFTWMLAYLREALEAFLKRDAAVINDQPYKDRRG